MSWLSIVWREFIALFVDDGSFALTLLLWILGSFISVHVLKVPPEVEAFILIGGLLVLLAENIQRAARAWEK
jgi:hypothetical protein